MLIDASRFPLVWMQIATPSKNPGDSPFAEFEALLARKEPFVLLNDEGLHQGSHEHSPDEMKQTSLWMKRHKSDLRTFVKASIHIEPSTPKRLAARAFAIVYEKFWGYPMLMTATKKEALALAQKLLAKEINSEFRAG
ncbi:hypothetical protein [Pseudomonas sp. LB3P14]